MCLFSARRWSDRRHEDLVPRPPALHVRADVYSVVFQVTDFEFWSPFLI